MNQKVPVISFRPSVRHPDLHAQIKALALHLDLSANQLIEKLILQGIIKEYSKLEPVKQNVEKVSYIDTLLKEFYTSYEKFRGTEFLNQFSGKDRSAMGKLLSIHKKKMPEADSEQTLRSFRVLFDSCLNIKDNWLYQNMSVPIILSKINDINIILRNNGKPRQITSDTINSIVDNR